MASRLSDRLLATGLVPLAGGAGGAQGGRSADPLWRACRARRDRVSDARAGRSIRALRRAGDLDRCRPAGDLRPADGAAAGSPLRAGRRSRAGAALASGAYTRAAADPARAPRRDPAAPAATARSPGAPRRAPARARAAPGPPAAPAATASSRGAPRRAPAGARAASGPAAVTTPTTARQERRPRSDRTSRRGGPRRGGTRRAGGDHQAGLRAQTQALGLLVEAARGRRSDRLAVRGALPQDRRDPGGRRTGAARAHRRVLRLRLRSPPRRPRGSPRPLAVLVDRAPNETLWLARTC